MRPIAHRRSRARAGCLRCRARRGCDAAPRSVGRSRRVSQYFACCARRSGRGGRARRSERRWACRRGPPLARRRHCSSGAERAADALRVPGWAGSSALRQAREEIADVADRRFGIAARRSARVVDVLARLLPRVEHHLLVGVVRVQRGDDALDRVVEQHRADADANVAELEAVRGAEERLVLADRLALVVEDRPAAADPARVRRPGRLRQRPGLGLDLLLDLAAEAVGVGEVMLDLQPGRAAGRCRGSRGRACTRTRAGGMRPSSLVR